MSKAALFRNAPMRAASVAMRYMAAEPLIDISPMMRRGNRAKQGLRQRTVFGKARLTLW